MTIQRTQQARIQKDFGRAATQYHHRAHLQRQVAERLVALARPWIPAQGKIIDIGCGTGFIGEYLQPAKASFYQLDIAPEMCAEAARFGHSIVGDMHALPFADATFDAALSSMSLQWAHNPHIITTEIIRVLKPRGLCVFSTLVDGTLPELRGLLQGIGAENRVLDYPTTENWRSALTPHGDIQHFTVETITQSFPDIRTMLASIRDIGAANKGANRAAPLSRAQWQQLQDTPQPITASWQVLYAIIQKR